MSRRPIQKLSTSLVNRIAAGEVIERPASVVKELVENALDAGSTRVLVEVEDGGREVIRVIDDGGGIPPAELPLAFAEHATSKLACDEDLFRIATMGFRGEALASIGAVSHARILSRVAGQDAAYEVRNQGGAVSEPQAAAGNLGTTVEVRNLFFNTPARRKFLKGSATEFGHVSEMLLRLALPYPRVAFRLSHNGKIALDLPATTAEDRLLAAWPREFHEQRLPLDAGDGELRVRGLVGLPELARPTAKYQFFYLNGRHVRDRFIQHAAREAYRGLTEPGRQPAVVLLLEVPAADVDVNVHPTKVEVRFRESGRVHGLVLSAVRQTLSANDLTPNALPRPVDGTPGANQGETAYREGLREKLAAFFQQLPPQAPGSTAGPYTVAGLPATGGPAGGLLPSLASVASPPARAPASDPAGVPSPAASPPEGGRSGERSAAHSVLPGPILSAIQLHNSYLVAQTEDGMVIIDQHALHERIMYEELRARLLRGPLESQRLLIPATVAASARQVALLDQVQPMLRRLGMEVSAFGPDAVAVHAFPSFLNRLDPEQFVRELLERGEQELLDLHEEELLHELLDLMACKAAVKAGDPLSPPEIEALLARRDLVERSSNCPHGRPTTLRLTLKDLEKQFKRTGF